MDAWRRRMMAFRGFAALGAGEYESARHSFDEGRNAASDRGLLQWYWRMYSHLGSGETFLGVGDARRANAEAETLLTAASGCDEALIKALAWNFKARLAIAAGGHNDAEASVLRALEIVEAVDVPPAAWQVHATAGEIYGTIDSAKAAAHRRRAQAIIDALAGSLGGEDHLRQALLGSARVRRILGAKDLDEQRPFMPSHGRV
jgi:hypothetical protein